MPNDRGFRPCEQGCGDTATVYAIDPMPDGWGGHYCESCARLLRFRVVDRYCPNDGKVLAYRADVGHVCLTCDFVRPRDPDRAEALARMAVAEMAVAR